MCKNRENNSNLIETSFELNEQARVRYESKQNFLLIHRKLSAFIHDDN